MTDNPSLMSFPCEFMIKVIGKNSDVFLTEIIEITRKHYPDTHNHSIRHQPSQQSSYLAISITVRAIDQATLDALYRELTLHPDVKMVL